MTSDMDAANQQTVIYTAEVRPKQDRFGGLVPEGVRLIYAMICEALHTDDVDSVGLSYGQYDRVSLRTMFVYCRKTSKRIKILVR